MKDPMRNGMTFQVAVVVIGVLVFISVMFAIAKEVASQKPTSEVYRICRDGTVVWKGHDGSFYIGYGATVSNPDEVCAP